MGIKIGDLDVGKEILNAKLNIEIILTILLRKGLITQKDYDDLKEEIIKKNYSKYILKDSDKDETKRV